MTTTTCNPAKQGQWTRVVSKNQRKDKSYSQGSYSLDPKTKPVKHYWNGFDKQGKERWYVELNNGIVVSSHNKDYEYWLKTYHQM